MRLNLLAIFLCIWTLLLSGCNEKGAPVTMPAPTNSTEKTEMPVPDPEPAVPDDPASLETLGKAGAKLKKDKAGQVVEVSFRGVPVTEEAIKSLAGLNSVRSILLNEAQTKDEWFESVAGLTTLENLDLRGATVGNDAMAHFAGLKNLRALRLNGENGSTTVDDDGMEHLAVLTSLKALALDFLWVSEVGLAHLQELPNLQELYLKESLVGDPALELLATFPSLKKLRLSKTTITAEGLSHLKKLPNIEMLDVSEGSLLDNAAMIHIGEMKSLKELNLWRLNLLTDEGVESLKGLTNLTWLNLDNTKLSDAGLPSLQEMQKLTFLHLGSTQITDEGLVHLEPLTSLEELILTRTGVTEAGAEALQKKLPNTKIQLKYIAGE